MKNIFLIPTERQTNLVRIWYNVEKTAFSFRINAEVNDSYKEYVNIYITDEEELKEGDYIFETDINTVNTADKDYSRNEFDFKIVLTNDTTLIEDGVQTIDDDFLEWFVKNPSCKEVEVEFETLWLNKRFGGTWQPFPDEDATRKKRNYKIVIPKEEFKQETLEEFIKANCHPNDGSKREGIELGVKWQKERMYSEEEVINIFFLGRESLNKFLITKEEVLEVIKQFKTRYGKF
jgi:hypothetical protein